MAQVSTITQANGTGAAVRGGFNNIIEALQSMNSGASAPNANATRDYTWWADLTNDQIKLRNAANDAWIVVADVLTGPDRLRFYSMGAEVINNAANEFTDTQRIKKASSLGQQLIGSDLNLGVSARLSLFGQNDNDEEVIGFEIDHDITDNTEDAETIETSIKTRIAGTLAERMRFGATQIEVTGTFEAAVLRQDGEDLEDIIYDAIDSLNSTVINGVNYTLLQADSGFAKRFTDTVTRDVVVGRLAIDSIFTFHNVGTADLEFVSAAPTNDVTFENGTTLQPGKSCTLVVVGVGATQADNIVRILGESV